MFELAHAEGEVDKEPTWGVNFDNTCLCYDGRV